MKNQQVSYEGMQEIYNVACSEWKKKIQEWTTPFTSTKLSAKQVEEMYKAANQDQTVVLDKWLNQSSALEKELEQLSLPYPNPKDQVEKCANSLIKMTKITSHYNKGETLSWVDTGKYKWVPYKYWCDGRLIVSARYHSLCDVPVACCFLRQEDAKEAYETFPEIYDDFYMITG